MIGLRENDSPAGSVASKRCPSWSRRHGLKLVPQSSAVFPSFPSQAKRGGCRARQSREANPASLGCDSRLGAVADCQHQSGRNRGRPPDRKGYRRGVSFREAGRRNKSAGRMRRLCYLWSALAASAWSAFGRLLRVRVGWPTQVRASRYKKARAMRAWIWLRGQDLSFLSRGVGFASLRAPDAG
jgi:hypothetical protein